jgi:hypothetical protein
MRTLPRKMLAYLSLAGTSYRELDGYDRLRAWI